MQRETLQLIADGLTDFDTGIVAQLATLPATADDDKPEGLAIVDAASDNELAKGEQLPRGKTVLALIVPDGPTVTQKANIKGEFSVGTTPIAISVVHRGALSAVKKQAQVYSVLRATALAMSALVAKAQEGRTRNEVRLLAVSQLAYGLVEDDGLGALGAVVFTVQSLDLRAQRTV